MKRTLVRLLCALGLPYLVRRLRRTSLTIVLYHGVAPAIEQGIYNYRGKFITPEAFDRQLRFIKEHYAVMPLDEAFDKLRSGTLPPYALSITFDDGYRNNAFFALPLLKRHGLQATFFLATDFVCAGKPLWVDRLEYAVGHLPGTKSQLIAKDAALRESMKHMDTTEREAELEKLERASGRALSDFSGDRAVYAPLSAADLNDMHRDMALGAHTESHPILSKLPPQDADHEIKDSLTILERSWRPLSKLFAYPNGQPGDWTMQCEAAAAAAGFVGALTTIEGTNTRSTHPFRLRRIALDGTEDDRLFLFAVSGARSWLRSLLTR